VLGGINGELTFEQGAPSRPRTWEGSDRRLDLWTRRSMRAVSWGVDPRSQYNAFSKPMSVSSYLLSRLTTGVQRRAKRVRCNDGLGGQEGLRLGALGQVAFFSGGRLAWSALSPTDEQVVVLGRWRLEKRPLAQRNQRWVDVRAGSAKPPDDVGKN